MIDYYGLFTSRLQENYGKKNANKLVELISSLSILLEKKWNEQDLEPMKQNKKEIEELLSKIQDKEEFVKQATREKKALNKKIKNIDRILNDKQLLQKEYEIRNETLPYDKKIFSMRVLSNIMKKEREELFKELESRNELLNPHKYVKYKNGLDEQYKYLRLLDEKDINKEIDKYILELQKTFLDCFKMKIQKAHTKDALTKLVFELRYYLNLQYTKTKTMSEVKNLSKAIENIIKTLLDKAIDEKVIVKIANNYEINYNIFSNILKTRIIDLSSINIKITKESEKIYFQILDENIFDKKIELCMASETENIQLQQKLNKNIKIFNV